MKLIDKDAVIAEIENLLDKGKYHEEYDCAYRDGNNATLYALKGKLDTLEVKEVDLPTPEEIKKICTIYDNLKQERECATILYNSDETFFNHVLMEYKSITQKVE